jgi:ribonucleoside-triphosphate reductase
MDAGYFLSMRAYIVYREQHGRRHRKTLVEVATSMNEYLDREDWRVQANANQGYSLGGLMLNVSGKVTANYWLDESTASRSAAHTVRPICISTISTCSPATAPAGRCARCCTKASMACRASVEAGPPKHLSECLGQMVNFSAPCKTNGPAPRRSARSTPISRPMCARTN